MPKVELANNKQNQGSSNPPPVSNTALTFDTARILIELCLEGKVVIVADRPVIFLSTMRKHWLAIGRKLQRERSSTFDPVKIRSISRSLSYIYSTRFSSTNKTGSDILVVPANHNLKNVDAFIFICSIDHKDRISKDAESSGNEFIVLT